MSNSKAIASSRLSKPPGPPSRALCLLALCLLLLLRLVGCLSCACGSLTRKTADGTRVAEEATQCWCSIWHSSSSLFSSSLDHSSIKDLSHIQAQYPCSTQLALASLRCSLARLAALAALECAIALFSASWGFYCIADGISKVYIRMLNSHPIAMNTVVLLLMHLLSLRFVQREELARIQPNARMFHPSKAQAYFWDGTQQSGKI